jgi:hypothetical protein
MYMKITDGADATTLATNNDATNPSHKLVTESYSASETSSRPGAGNHSNEAISNDGSVNFGSPDSLYGKGQTNSGSDAPTPTPKAVPSIHPAAIAPPAKPNPSSQEQQQIVDQQLRTAPQSPADIGLSSVNASGVDQANVGDCYFESAVASLANTPNGEQAIRNMISTNSDGSYTVTFPGDTSHPVTVTQQDLATNQQNDQVEDTDQWGRIIQTAFLKYDGSEQYGTELNALQYEGTPALGLNTTDEALHLLTGGSTATDSLGMVNVDNSEVTLGNTSTANVARNLETAFKNGDPVTASVEPWQNTPMPSSHVYSVLSYNPQTDKVVVRNPWGNNDDTPLAQVNSTVDGITNIGGGNLEMSLETFTKNVSDVNFANVNPYVNDVQNTLFDAHTADTALARTGSDLIQGKFGNLGGDSLDTGNDILQMESDILYTTTDSAERAVGNAWNTDVNLVNGAVHDLNPMNW